MPRLCQRVFAARLQNKGVAQVLIAWSAIKIDKLSEEVIAGQHALSERQPDLGDPPCASA